MKNKFLYLVMGAFIITIFVVQGTVSARQNFVSIDTNPAAGSWIWDSKEIAGTIVPQHQLASTYVPDYALLQSEGLHVSGATKICHPYPGGQFGWHAEIRLMTLNGWEAVSTVNEWVPDEEGQFMTCAQVWHSGTYAIFGYWIKPEGWVVVDHSCDFLPEGEFEYVGPIATFDWTMAFGPAFAGTTGDRCLVFDDFVFWPWAIETDNLIVNGVNYGYSYFLSSEYLCACDNVYHQVGSTDD